jgi:hypothetical protein
MGPVGPVIMPVTVLLVVSAALANQELSAAAAVVEAEAAGVVLEAWREVLGAMGELEVLARTVP